MAKNCTGRIVSTTGESLKDSLGNEMVFEIAESLKDTPGAIRTLIEEASEIISEEAFKQINNTKTVTFSNSYTINSKVGFTSNLDVLQHFLQIENVAQNYPDIAKLLDDNMNVAIVEDFQTEDGKKPNGMYIERTNTIVIRTFKDGKERTQTDILNTLRHELIHAKNNKKIDQSEELRDKIEALYKELVSLKREGLIMDNSLLGNALKNLGSLYNKGSMFDHKETLAYLFGNLDIVNFLSTNTKTSLLYQDINNLLEAMPTIGSLKAEERTPKEQLIRYAQNTVETMIVDDITFNLDGPTLSGLDYAKKKVTVISGGQSGIDQIGLMIAKMMGIKTTGTAPAGYKTTYGNDYELETKYNLKTNNSADYSARTKENVKNSDITIYFSKDGETPGYKATLKAAKENGKSFVGIFFDEKGDIKVISVTNEGEKNVYNSVKIDDIRYIISYTVGNDVSENSKYTINIAGNRMDPFLGLNYDSLNSEQQKEFNAIYEFYKESAYIIADVVNDINQEQKINEVIEGLTLEEAFALDAISKKRHLDDIEKDFYKGIKNDYYTLSRNEFYSMMAYPEYALMGKSDRKAYLEKMADILPELKGVINAAIEGSIQGNGKKAYKDIAGSLGRHSTLDEVRSFFETKHNLETLKKNDLKISYSETPIDGFWNVVITNGSLKPIDVNKQVEGFWTNKTIGEFLNERIPYIMVEHLPGAIRFKVPDVFKFFNYTPHPLGDTIITLKDSISNNLQRQAIKFGDIDKVAIAIGNDQKNRLQLYTNDGRLVFFECSNISKNENPNRPYVSITVEGMEGRLLPGGQVVNLKDGERFTAVEEAITSIFNEDFKKELDKMVSIRSEQDWGKYLSELSNRYNIPNIIGAYDTVAKNIVKTFERKATQDLKNERASQQQEQTINQEAEDAGIYFDDTLLEVKESDMMPKTYWNKEGKTFENMKEAQDFFNKRKEHMQNYWHMPEVITNEFQLRSIKSGDIIKLSMKYDFTGDSEYSCDSYGLKGNNGYLSMPICEVWERFSTETKEDIMANFGCSEAQANTIMSKRQKWLKDNEKYKAYTQNYLTHGVFWDNEAQRWAAYIFTDGKGKGKDRVFSTRIFLDTKYIHSVRRLDDSYRTNYTYDKATKQFKVVEKTTNENIEYIKQDTATIEAARARMKEMKASKDEDFKKQLEDDKFYIGTISKNGKYENFLGKYGESADMTGFYGELGNFAKEVDNLSIIKYRKDKTSSFGVKVGNVPGGIAILDSNGKITTISGDAITKVVASLNEDTELSDIAEYESKIPDVDRYFNGKGKTIQTNANLYPFFRSTEDWRQEGDTDEGAKKREAEERQKMASNLKRGDIIQLAWYSKGEWHEGIFKVFSASSTRVMYMTKDGSLNWVSATSVNGFKGKKVAVNGKYYLTKDGKTPCTEEGLAEIRAAYSFNNKGRLYDYFSQYRATVERSFEKGRKLDIETASNVEDLVSKALGFNYGNKKVQADENNNIPASKESVEAEWTIEDFRDYTGQTNRGQVIERLSTLIPGDIVITRYTDKEGKEHLGKHVFVGYNKQGYPMMVERKRQQKGDSYFTMPIYPGSVVGVGTRITPISYDKNSNSYVNDYADNYKDVEGVNMIEVSPGRPNEVEAMKERLTFFVEEGQKLALFDTKQDAQNWINSDNNRKKSWWNDSDKTGYTFKTIEKYLFKNEKTGAETYAIESWSSEGYKIDKSAPVKYGVVINHQTKGKVNYTSHLKEMNKDKRFEVDIYENYLTFKDVQKMVNRGDFINVERDGKYYNCVVMYSSPSKITGYFFTKTDDGLVIRPMFITPKSGSTIKRINIDPAMYSTIKSIKEAARKRGKEELVAESTVDETVNDRAKNEDFNLPFSKKLKRFKKTHDSKQAIRRIAKRMSNLYDTPINIMDSTEFEALGIRVGRDLSNVRGLVYNGEVYINFEVASTADVLHELTHLILPGLKSANPELYAAIIAKVENHPAYSEIAENYPELSREDLAEEAFCTIFGEYFRNKAKTYEETEWAGNDIMELSNSIPGVLVDTLNLSSISNTGYELMNMTLEDIMDSFGSDLVRGRFSKLVNTGVELMNSRELRAIYDKLINSGQLIRLC